MANEQNLRPGEYKLTLEEQKKGGIASGIARRKKADLQKAFKTAMETTYTEKNGMELTGEEIVIRSLIANLSNPNGRNFSASLGAAMTLLDAKESNLDKKIKKAELDLLVTKTDLLKGGDDTGLRKLDDILKGLEDHAIADAVTE